MLAMSKETEEQAQFEHGALNARLENERNELLSQVKAEKMRQKEEKMATLAKEGEQTKA